MSILLVAAALAAETSPAMVTLVKGPVTVVTAGSASAAPAAPFLLPAGSTLQVGAGGRVVLLRQGGAHAVDGPATVDPAGLRVQGSASDAVAGLLEKRTSLATAGASRGGTLTVVRPVPQAPVLALGEIRWTCQACGTQDVSLVDLRADSTLWTARGEGSVTYGGPALRPGTYVVRVGTTESALRVPARTEADALVAAAHLDAIADPTDRAAALGGTYLLAGYPTDALAVLEGAGLTDLVLETERLAGLRP